MSTRNEEGVGKNFTWIWALWAWKILPSPKRREKKIVSKWSFLYAWEILHNHTWYRKHTR